MKKIASLLTVSLFIILSSCGPSQEELERQQRIDDSLMEIERKNILERANKILEAPSEKDSIAENDSL